MAVARLGVWRIVTRPAAWSVDVMIVGTQVGLGLPPGLQPGGGVEPSGAPRVLNSTPAEAVVSFAITVLLTNFTRNASCSDTPPPSQPATLLAMMLFCTVTSFQR